ncbi:MAG: arsenosugar biosynthesis radical SAM protein ArsS [Chloroherpetonaceae bacterium]|nr:arsenosugar biosynthesis radical SAM protein ArsS [Chloroherpetonaceae bacterium]MDW8019851.1 arsenosugar biosynthesis radical SAM protein ArsS [Chloroherpetonaceae bacterium]
MVRHKSMQAFGEALANAETQLEIIQNRCTLPPFDETYQSIGEGPLTATGIEVFQVNVGKLCNQVCRHCHVDAGPDRREIMSRETMQLCLEALAKTDVPKVDITGGAPEMNPNFRWFVSEVKKLGRHVMVRSNLTILLAKGYEDLPEFFAAHGVEVISSLPHYTATNTDKQRGEGVFERSIEAIRRLNHLGYGQEGSGLILNLVYNPVGAFLPPNQAGLEADYKRVLNVEYGVQFNHLYTITNMPIGRFLDYLIASGNYESYMQRLVSLFNPAAARNVMCRTTLSIGWDGTLYDCDFNQMLELKVGFGAPMHIKDFDFAQLRTRRIVTKQHCYGCTAGAGSSCGGAIA